MCSIKWIKFIYLFYLIFSFLKYVKPFNSEEEKQKFIPKNILASIKILVPKFWVTKRNKKNWFKGFAQILKFLF